MSPYRYPNVFRKMVIFFIAGLSELEYYWKYNKNTHTYSDPACRLQVVAVRFHDRRGGGVGFNRG